MTTTVKVKSVRKLVCIEYPGIVENVGNMLQTFNGLSAIENTYNDEANRLELRFRPQDVYSHPTFGDRSACNNLLIKFKRRRKPDGSYEYESELVGIVETCYQFKSLADFQYLPIQKMNADDQSLSESGSSLVRYKSIAEEIIPNDPLNPAHPNALRRTFIEDSPHFIMPTVFSRFDSPIEYHYRDEAKHRDPSLRNEIARQSELSIIGRTRKSRSVIAFFVTWSDETPTGTTETLEKALETTLAKQTNKKMLVQLKKAFELRPIWSRNALVGHLKCDRDDIKYLLPKIAYYFSNGPYRCMWIKFGYDPRKEKSSRIYQTLDFRVKQVYSKNVYGNDSCHAKRSIYQYQLPLKKNVTDPKTKAPTFLSEAFSSSPSKSTSGAGSSRVTRGTDNEAEYIFRPGLMPACRQLFYQLCNIKVEEVEKIVNASYDDAPLTCSEKDGWFPHGTIDKIRSIMLKIIDDMLADKKKDKEDEDEEMGEADEEEEDEEMEVQDDEYLEYFA